MTTPDVTTKDPTLVLWELTTANDPQPVYDGLRTAAPGRIMCR